MPRAASRRASFQRPQHSLRDRIVRDADLEQHDVRPLRAGLAEGGDPLLTTPAVHPSGTARRLDVRPMTAWEFYDDADARAGGVLARLADASGARRHLARLAVDRLGTPGYLALAREV